MSASDRQTGDTATPAKQQQQHPNAPSSPSDSHRRGQSNGSSRRRIAGPGGDGSTREGRGGNNSGGDLASLFVNAQRRNADKARKTQADQPKSSSPKPSKSSAQQPPRLQQQQQQQQQQQPAPLREIPKPTTPATRTIHHALGVSRRKQMPSSASRNRTQSNDRRQVDSEFQRDPPRSNSEGPTAGSDSPAKATSGLAEASSPSRQPPTARQLFDPKQHDPATFRAAARTPAAASAGDASPAMSATNNPKQLFDPSAASVSSEVPSSKAGSPDRSDPPPKGQTQRSVSPLPPATLSQPVAGQAHLLATDALKEAYRRIQVLEEECLGEAEQERRRLEDGNFVRNKAGRSSSMLDGFEDPNAYWIVQVQRHKELAEAHAAFLYASSDPQLPVALQSMPTKYKTPIRLWQHAFHLLLERIRHVLGDAPDLIEILLEFLNHAYGFYTCLLEDHSLTSLRHLWLEQLGDLARYRLAVAQNMTRLAAAAAAADGEQHHGRLSTRVVEAIDDQDVPVARLDDEGAADDGDAASIGPAALEDLKVDDADVWSRTALEWYSQALIEAPDVGRLHHHLALLHKDDELKSLYHFSKSLVAGQPYGPSSESVLALFSPEQQARRVAPSQATPDSLFVHLYGLLLTRVGLDDFDDILDRFLIKLEEAHNVGSSDLTSVRWMMMGVLSTCALLQCGKRDAPLVQALLHHPAAEKDPAPDKKGSAPQAILLNPSSGKADKEKSDPDDSDEPIQQSDAAHQMQQLNLEQRQSSVQQPQAEDSAQVCAIRMTSRLLRFVAAHPTFCTTTQSEVINPYCTILLTFLSHLFSHAFKVSFPLLERHLPWEEMIELFNKIPSDYEVRQDNVPKVSGPPLVEDWCAKGLLWSGSGLFPKRFWKLRSGSRKVYLYDSEFAVLEGESEEYFIGLLHAASATTAAIEEDIAVARWKRLAILAGCLSKIIPGVSCELDAAHGKRFRLANAFAQKAASWRREDQADSKKRSAQRSGAISGADDALSTDESEPEDGDPPHLAQTKARRRDLRNLIRTSRSTPRRPSESDQRRGRASGTVRAKPLALFPGYTMLVVDATMLLRALPAVRYLIESKSWTLVVPLAVITDLDSKRSDAACAEALSFLEDTLRTDSLYLKIQTSKGNYLPDLRFRSEDVEEGTKLDIMDMVLRTARWQKDNFVNRLSLTDPAASASAPPTSLKVVLLTLNQKFRLKARSEQVEALNDGELLNLVAKLPTG